MNPLADDHYHVTTPRGQILIRVVATSPDEAAQDYVRVKYGKGATVIRLTGKPFETTGIFHAINRKGVEIKEDIHVL